MGTSTLTGGGAGAWGTGTTSLKRPGPPNSTWAVPYRTLLTHLYQFTHLEHPVSLRAVMINGTLPPLHHSTTLPPYHLTTVRRLDGDARSDCWRGLAQRARAPALERWLGGDWRGHGREAQRLFSFIGRPTLRSTGCGPLHCLGRAHIREKLQVLFGEIF
jgi:hypothetical protein